MSASIVKRPPKGREGRPCNLLVNFYLLKNKHDEIYMYDVEITPEIKNKVLRRDIIEEIRPSFGVGYGYAFDGAKSLYTNKKIDNAPLLIDYEIKVCYT